MIDIQPSTLNILGLGLFIIAVGATMGFHARLEAARMYGGSHERREPLMIAGLLLGAAASLGLTLLSACAVLATISCSDEAVGKTAFEVESTAKIRSFSTREMGSLGVSGTTVGAYILRSLSVDVSAKSETAYIVMEDTYGDGGFVRAEYPASTTRIYEDVDGADECSRVEVVKIVERQWMDWLMFHCEWDEPKSVEVRIHVEPGTVLDVGA